MWLILFMRLSMCGRDIRGFCLIHCQYEKARQKAKPSQNDARLFRKFLQKYSVFTRPSCRTLSIRMEIQTWKISCEPKMSYLLPHAVVSSFLWCDKCPWSVCEFLKLFGYAFSHNICESIHTLRPFVWFHTHTYTQKHILKFIFKASFDRTTKMFSLHTNKHIYLSIFMWQCGMAYKHTLEINL